MKQLFSFSQKRKRARTHTLNYFTRIRPPSTVCAPLLCFDYRFSPGLPLCIYLPLSFSHISLCLEPINYLSVFRVFNYLLRPPPNQTRVVLPLIHLWAKTCFCFSGFALVNYLTFIMLI